MSHDDPTVTTIQGESSLDSPHTDTHVYVCMCYTRIVRIYYISIHAHTRV